MQDAWPKIASKDGKASSVHLAEDCSAPPPLFLPYFATFWTQTLKTALSLVNWQQLDIFGCCNFILSPAEFNLDGSVLTPYSNNLKISFFALLPLLNVPVGKLLNNLTLQYCNSYIGHIWIQFWFSLLDSIGTFVPMMPFPESELFKF